MGCNSVEAQIPIIVTIDPTFVKVVSGGQIQFKVSVINTTNTAVTWYSCASGAIDQNGLFTAPDLTKPAAICVYVISVADPSKSATAFVTVTPKIIPITCPTTSPWIPVPDITYYQLPTWMTTPGPAPLIWIQPADIIYSENKKILPVDASSGNILPSINTWSGGTTQYCDWLLVQGGTPPYTYSVSYAPIGLKVNATTGQYSGIATTPGKYSNIIFCAKDSVGTEVCLKPRIQSVCDGGKTGCLM